MISGSRIRANNQASDRSHVGQPLTCCMKHALVVFAAAAAAALLFATPAFSAAERYPLTPADRAFFADLKKALRAAEREWLAERICYPLLVQIDGEERSIASRDDFLKDYASIMPVSVAAVVDQQTADTLLKTERGIMVGDGEIWFKEASPLSAVAKVSSHCITTITARTAGGRAPQPQGASPSGAKKN